jgi:hypothetical protein
MRQSRDARLINVNKSTLIEKIKANKENHKKEYDEAVIAYGVVAKRQLTELNKRLKKNEMDLSLRLVTPVNKTDEYDKLLVMFEMEVEDVIQLSQGEFNEYVHDETSFAINAKMLNSTYLA